MKTSLPTHSLAAASCLLLASFAQSADYTNLVRQIQQAKTNVSWDMPVAPTGTGPAALLVEEGGSLFQLWTISTQTAAEFLLDQKLVGAYLPKGNITIHALDS